MDIFEILRGFFYVFVLSGLLFMICEFLISGIKYHKKALKYLEFLNQSQKFDVDKRKDTSLGKKK